MTQFTTAPARIEPRQRTASAPRRLLLWAVALAAIGLGTAGCAPEASSARLDAQAREPATPQIAPSDGLVIHLRDTAQVKEAILRVDRPVIVYFYKGGCPSCFPVDGMMTTLAQEYKGRATITRFMLMEPYFAVTSPELKDKYEISFFPVVILFVNGQETWRLTVNYNLEDYRKALDQALALPAAPAGGQADVVSRQ